MEGKSVERMRPVSRQSSGSRTNKESEEESHENFLTGSTGYLGSYLASMLMREHSAQLALLVRAEDAAAAEKRLWKSLQLHMEFDEFIERVRSQVRIFTGDLTSPRFGLSDGDYQDLVEETESIIHCAASQSKKCQGLLQRQPSGNT